MWKTLYECLECVQSLKGQLLQLIWRKKTFSISICYVSVITIVTKLQSIKRQSFVESIINQLIVLSSKRYALDTLKTMSAWTAHCYNVQRYHLR